MQSIRMYFRIYCDLENLIWTMEIIYYFHCFFFIYFFFLHRHFSELFDWFSLIDKRRGYQGESWSKRLHWWAQPDGRRWRDERQQRIH
jgi:hypothetical protein